MDLSLPDKQQSKQAASPDQPIIHTQRNKTLDLLMVHLNSSVTNIRCSADGTFIVCAIENQIRIYDSALTIQIATLVGHTCKVNQVEIWQNSKIAYASDDMTVRVWNVENLQQILVVEEPKIYQFEFLSENTIIMLTKNLTIILWSISDGQQIFRAMPQYLVYDIQQLPHEQVLLHPQSKIITLSQYFKTAYVWNLMTGSCDGCAVIPTNRMQCDTFSSDGNYLYSGSYDRKLFRRSINYLLSWQSEDQVKN